MGWLAPQLSPMRRVLAPPLPPSPPLPPQPAATVAIMPAAKRTEINFFTFMIHPPNPLLFSQKYFFNGFTPAAKFKHRERVRAYSSSKTMTIFFISLGGWMMFSKTCPTWLKGI